MNLLSNILALVFLLIMSVIAVRELHYSFRKHASKNWPTVEATIESVAVRRGGPALALFLMYRIYSTYSYSVNGGQYKGVFALITDNKKSGEGLRQALIGRKLLVRYDTRHPAVSFLSDARMMGKRVMQQPLWT